MFDQTNTALRNDPLIDRAWTTLEAANDLGDGATIEVCRRVIDASLRGVAPADSDVNIISDFFG
jgi:hypothetical protein